MSVDGYTPARMIHHEHASYIGSVDALHDTRQRFSPEKDDKPDRKHAQKRNCKQQAKSRKKRCRQFSFILDEKFSQAKVSQHLYKGQRDARYTTSHILMIDSAKHQSLHVVHSSSEPLPHIRKSLKSIVHRK